MRPCLKLALAVAAGALAGLALAQNNATPPKKKVDKASPLLQATPIGPQEGRVNKVESITIKQNAVPASPPPASIAREPGKIEVPNLKAPAPPAPTRR